VHLEGGRNRKHRGGRQAGAPGPLPHADSGQLGAKRKMYLLIFNLSEKSCKCVSNMKQKKKLRWLNIINYTTCACKHIRTNSFHTQKCREKFNGHEKCRKVFNTDLLYVCNGRKMNNLKL
jgi:hypothetical protein